MRWETPYVLFLLLLVPVLIVIAALRFKLRKRSFRKFAEDKFFSYLHYEYSGFYALLKLTLLIFAVFFLVLATARPQWDKESQVVKKEGIDIVLAVDVSYSMLAEDIKPNRLERAKDQISLFIDQLKGDRVAVVAFAGESFVECPLTDDYAAAKMFTSLLNVNTVQAYGTDIAKALDCAADLFTESQKYKIVILLSDGEDLEQNAVKKAQDLARQGIMVYAMGVGSPDGAPIPMKDNQNQVNYAKDESGNIVLSKLDVTTLTAIANAGGGRFYPITPQQAEIFEVLKQISSIEKRKFDAKEYARYKDQYKYFTLIALIFILIEFFILNKQKRKIPRFL